MTKLPKWGAVLAAVILGSAAFAASPRYACGLTGKVSSKCCCVQKAGKLLCKNTGKTLDACCCTTK